MVTISGATMLLAVSYDQITWEIRLILEAIRTIMALSLIRTKDHAKLVTIDAIYSHFLRDR